MQDLLYGLLSWSGHGAVDARGVDIELTAAVSLASITIRCRVSISNVPMAMAATAMKTSIFDTV